MDQNDRRVSFYTRDPENLRVSIEGHIEGHPFAALIHVNKEEAIYLPEHMVARDIGQVERATPAPAPAPAADKKKKSDCPGCKSTLLKLAKGGWGWSKHLLGIDQRPEEEVQEIKEICRNCPSNCYDFGICRDDWPDRPDEEQGCGCVLELKVRQASEECPHKHWGKHGD